MEMCVSNGLTRPLADIDAQVVTIRQPAQFDATSHGTDQGPDGRLFVRRQGKEIGFVPSRQNEAVARIQRERIDESDGAIVLRDELAVGQPVTENARQSLPQFHVHPPAPT